MSSLLVVEQAEAIMTLRLNRPDKRNALNSELRSALVRGLEQAREDPGVRVVVLTGTGIKARPPLLGKHTREVLAELGYAGAEIHDLPRSPRRP